MAKKGQKLLILGAGGHGRVCAEIARAQGVADIGFLDSRYGRGDFINGIEVIGNGIKDLQRRFPADSVSVFVAIGENRLRSTLCEQISALGYDQPVLRHPSAILSPSAVIGANSVVMPGVIVNANARIGRHCILNTASSLDHDNVLEDGVHICPGVRSAGTVHFGARSLIGTGASLIPNVRVGRDAVVGAGAVVVRDVPAGARVAGNPARALERSPVTGSAHDVPESASALDAADRVGTRPGVDGIEPPKDARIGVPPIEECIDITSQSARVD